MCFLFRVLLTALLVAKWGLYSSKKFLLLTGLLSSPMLLPCRWLSSWFVTDHFLITVSISHYHSWLDNDKIFQRWAIPQSLSKCTKNGNCAGDLRSRRAKGKATSFMYSVSFVNLCKRRVEERRWQTLCDKFDK